MWYEWMMMRGNFYHKMWLVKCSFLVKHLPQISQRNGVSFVCERMWLAKCSFLVYFLPQTVHWWGVSPDRAKERKQYAFIQNLWRGHWARLRFTLSPTVNSLSIRSYLYATCSDWRSAPYGWMTSCKYHNGAEFRRCVWNALNNIITI